MYNNFSSYGDIEYNDDVEYIITEWGCLSTVLLDYGIDTSVVKSKKVGQHIVDDFMDLMCRFGYIEK